jgi:hypothetical protein
MLKQCPFYDAFTVKSATFITFVAGLTDCPGIAKEKITDIVATHGEDSPRFIPLLDRRSTKSSRTPAMALVTFPRLNDSETTVFALKRAPVLRSSQTWGRSKIRSPSDERKGTETFIYE